MTDNTDRHPNARASNEMFCVPFGEVTEFMPGGDGRPAYGIDWGGPSALVKSTEADDAAVAAYLARAPAAIMAHEQTIAKLERDLSAARALVPKRKTRLLGPGCVRQDPHHPERLWLLNTQHKGWASFGIVVEGGWDELFRRFDVIVSDPDRDTHGMYWMVRPRKGEQ